MTFRNANSSNTIVVIHHDAIILPNYCSNSLNAATVFKLQEDKDQVTLRFFIKGFHEQCADDNKNRYPVEILSTSNTLYDNKIERL